MRKKADMVMGNLVSLVLTAMIIVFIAAFAILIWNAFFSRPEQREELYTKNNFERLNEHIKNLIETDKPFDTIVIPYYIWEGTWGVISARGYSVVGKGYGDEKVTVDFGIIGDDREITFPKKCRGKACLCLCVNLVCGEEFCHIFRSSEARYIIGEPHQNGFCNIKDPIPNLEDPLGNPASHLGIFGKCPMGFWQSRNLYIERSKRGSTVFLYMRDFPDDENARRQILLREEQYIEKYGLKSKCQPACADGQACVPSADGWVCKSPDEDYISYFIISDINNDGSIVLEWAPTEFGRDKIAGYKVYEMSAEYADADKFQNFDYSNEIECTPELKDNTYFVCTTTPVIDTKRHMFGLRAIDESGNVLDGKTTEPTGEKPILMKYLSMPMNNIDEELFNLAVESRIISISTPSNELYQYLTDKIPGYTTLNYGEFLAQMGCVDTEANDPSDNFDLWQKKQDLIQVITTALFDDFGDVKGIAPKGEDGFVLPSKITVDYEPETEKLNFYGDIGLGTSEIPTIIKEIPSSCTATQAGLVISIP